MKRFRHTETGVLLVVLILLGAMTAMAQGDPTPTPTLPATPAEQAATVQAALNYPVAIHQGTCESPTAQPAFELGNADPYGAGSGDATTLGTSATSPVLEANGEVDAILADVANEGHVIAVHASPDDFATILACGGIAGTQVDGKLVISLQPVGEATVSGIAILEGDDPFTVTVYLTSQGEGGAFPTPETTPTPVS
jgi:hypothetical protein